MCCPMRLAAAVALALLLLAAPLPHDGPMTAAEAAAVEVGAHAVVCKQHGRDWWPCMH